MQGAIGALHRKPGQIIAKDSASQIFNYGMSNLSGPIRNTACTQHCGSGIFANWMVLPNHSHLHHPLVLHGYM